MADTWEAQVLPELPVGLKGSINPFLELKPA